MCEEFETIDLTSSFDQLDDLNIVMSDTIIEINDSYTHVYSSGKYDKSSKKIPHNSTPQNDNQESSSKNYKGPTFKCPICLEDMQNISLASTKCGHVFCMNCLKKSLKETKTCPKCRQAVTGQNAYHPVYL